MMNIVIGLCHDSRRDLDTFSESVDEISSTVRTASNQSDREGHESFELLSTDSEKVSKYLLLHDNNNILKHISFHIVILFNDIVMIGKFL